MYSPKEDTSPIQEKQYKTVPLSGGNISLILTHTQRKGKKERIKRVELKDQNKTDS